MRLCSVPGCDHPHRARGFCSTHYNQTKPTRHERRQVECAVCAVVIGRPYTSTRRPTCSVACRAVLQHGVHNGPSGYDWAADAAQRAREAGARVAEVFDRDAVFARDNWTCYLCGEVVDADASPFDPRSATVDHVVPLSRGGEHSMGNAGCAHLRCNSIKADGAVGDAPAAVGLPLLLW